jgi:hypothetical protein
VTSACNTVSGGSVTASTINAALASAPANTYVYVPAGTYTITSAITFNSQSNITLRGAGANSTFLVFSGITTDDIYAQSSDTNYPGGPSNTANWLGTNGSSGTYTRGATSILLDNVTNLHVGSQLILDQIDTQSDNSGLYVGCERGSDLSGDSSNACYHGAGPNGFERGESALSTIRGQQQIVNVTSISGSSSPYTVGITPGIYGANYATGNSPGAWWASYPLQGDAVENISLDHTNGAAGILFFNCTNCWVKGIRGIRASSTATGWFQVGLQQCNHCTVRDSYFYGYEGDSYQVAVEVASDCLIENNILQWPSASVWNSDCEGCVLDYNFQVNAWSNGSTFFGQSHWFHGVQLFALDEGNIGPGLYADSFHGTHDLNTQFRNRYDGREQNDGNVMSSGTIAMRMNPGTRYDNLIGNVLGTPGYHTVYESTPTSFGNIYKSVINLGTYPETYAGGCTSDCAPYDALTGPTSMFWGNWDNVTGTVRWCGNSSDTGWSTTCSSTSEVPTRLSQYANAVPRYGDTGAGQSPMPASFIYASKPSWWPSGKAWPPIGPDVTGGNVGQCSGGTYDTSEAFSSSQCTGGSFSAVAGGMVTSIPAMDCYFNVMGGVANGTGNPLAFNADSCYDEVAPPAPPTNVSAIAH